MMKIIVLIMIFVVGCGNADTYCYGTLICGRCGRTVYEGKMNVGSNGFIWPAGAINHHKPWDKLCVSKLGINKEAHYEAGKIDGYQDGCKGRNKPIFTDDYAEQYIKGYNKGYEQSGKK